MLFDETLFVALRRQDLLVEAERERLAARVPRRPSAARRELALACYRLADWLDHTTPKRYFQPSETGGPDWARVR